MKRLPRITDKVDPKVDEFVARMGTSKTSHALALQEMLRRTERRLHAAPGGLMRFVRYFWEVIEPDTEFQEGWALEAIALHLEAVAAGAITRLLINVPPGSCKSLLSSVFFPLWCWAALGRPGLRFLALSYTSSLTERDNRKMLHIIRSEKFQALYGRFFSMTKEGVELIVTDKTGQKQASSVGGTVTGARADIVILDDPNSIKEVESEVVRTETARFFREALSNRLNHMTKSAIVVIQQRSHEEDISGVILSEGLPYDHLCIPMLYEQGRTLPTVIGWQDPRTEEGECFWPERFPEPAVAEAKRMGDYAFAGQYQQRPSPRGGGIFKVEWWQDWEPADGKYPPIEFIIASADTAYTDKKQNDPTAMVILGVNFDDDGNPRVFLLDAWRRHLQLHGPDIPREMGERYDDYVRRAKDQWGLVEWIGHSCKRWKVSRLLIEGKASGLSVAQEMARMMYHKSFAIDLINPGRADKVARATRVQPIFAAGQVWRPMRAFADMVVDEMASFPRGKHDDLTDAMTQALWWLRENNWLERREERAFAERQYAKPVENYNNNTPLYPV